MTRPRWWRAGRAGLVLAAEFLGFALLLFVTRFVLRGHLIPEMDQECHIGGIADELLRHGLRFPLLAYAPNEYDNGSLVSGALLAPLYRVFGPSVLAIKLVTHAFVSAGCVAALSLLRVALRELGVKGAVERRAAVATLVLLLAFAPRVVTLFSLNGVANHAEGTAIDVMLIALFAQGWRSRSAARTGLYWLLVGLALYVNKGTVLALVVLGVAELALPGRSGRRIAAAAAGFMAGVLPELAVLVGRHARGWLVIADKAGRNSSTFPRGFLGSVWNLADTRPTLALLWCVALGSAAAWAWRRVRSYTREDEPESVATVLVVMTVLAHLLALTRMARFGIDPYSLYGHPFLSVLLALLVGRGASEVAARSGARAGLGAALGLAALAAFAARPDALRFDGSRVASLARNRDGAVCSWRFAEGFEREYQHGLAPGASSEIANAIARCRQLTGPQQSTDCIGGIGRELNWRRNGHPAGGEPPPGLTDVERRAYAWQFGTHRRGNVRACDDFHDADLRAVCAGATEMDCLMYADAYAGLTSGKNLPRAHCDLPEAPMGGYWSARRRDLLTRADLGALDISHAHGEDDLRACRPVLQRCFERPDRP